MELESTSRARCIAETPCQLSQETTCINDVMRHVVTKKRPRRQLLKTEMRPKCCYFLTRRDFGASRNRDVKTETTSLVMTLF